jgi:hypothetical protein
MAGVALGESKMDCFVAALLAMTGLRGLWVFIGKWSENQFGEDGVQAFAAFGGGGEGGGCEG